MPRPNASASRAGPVRRLGAHRGCVLWWVDLKHAYSASANQCLSAEEWALVRRKPAAVRSKTMTAYVARRHILSKATGVAPAALRFGYNAQGKKHLLGAPELEFNQSYSAGGLLLAVSHQGQVGVDWERAPQASTLSYEALLALAQQFFNAVERAHLAQCAVAERWRLFGKIWVLKESVIKALGLGFAMDLAQVALPLNMLVHQGRRVEGVVSVGTGPLADTVWRLSYAQVGDWQVALCTPEVSRRTIVAV
ncbi:MAG: 4'-phosphopantetheinyl transferase superfamily protein [Neisseriaceae bacterium]|nr:4'-phosphopantetheinyl transferase superfamily protein [Neisseriaceae bacterium]MBP6862425.1 4'-phosphopantetheinyl transferase superfamily protein [Neisseriaceae bacterium]